MLLLSVRSQKHIPGYELWLAMPETATLQDIDVVLRRVWMECCGHLSTFSVGSTTYANGSGGDDYDDAGFSMIGDRPMSYRVVDALEEAKGRKGDQEFERIMKIMLGEDSKENKKTKEKKRKRKNKIIIITVT